MNDEKMETEVTSKMNDTEAMDTGSPKVIPANGESKERGKYDWTENIKPHIKIAVMGESGCGKSSLILAATNQVFHHPSDKYVSKSHFYEFDVNGKKEECMITEIDDWDKNEGRREKLYTEKDIVVLLCFNHNRELEEFKKKWMFKFENHNVPVVFVKIFKLPPIAHGEGVDRRPVSMDAPDDCMTCSPYKKLRVQEVFQEAIRKVKA